MRDRDTDPVILVELSKSTLTYGLRLVWTGDPLIAAHPAVRHLVAARSVGRSRELRRYGMLTWRRGPGYVLVDDSRNSAVRQSLTLEMPPLIELFGELLDQPVIVHGAEALLAELATADLVAFCGARAVWLPYRFLRSPVNVALVPVPRAAAGGSSWRWT